MKKTFLTYLFAFFFCLLFISGTASSFFYSVAFDADKYMERMEKDGYSQIVLSNLHNQIDSIGDVISLEADDIYALLDEKSICEHSKNYTRTYLEAILNGKDFIDSEIEPYSIEYAKSGLKKLVESFYETSENSFSEEEFEIIYNYIESQINRSLKFLSSTILEKTVPLGRYMVKAKEILKTLRLALIPAALLFIGVVLVNVKNKAGKIIYRAGGTLFIPSALLFIPAFLFDNYNLGEKVVIAKSPLSVVFSSVVNTLVKGFEGVSGIFFAISFVLVITGAIIIVRTTGKKTSKGEEANDNN